MYYVGCQGLRHKSATVWLLNYYFLFPTTLDRLRMSSQVFSNKFIAVCLLTKILACSLSQYLTSNIIKFFTFSFWRQKTKSFIHSAIQVQVTNTLESQFWGLCFFSWHNTKKKTPKVSNISITVKYDSVINVTWQCINYWKFYIYLLLQM